MYSLDPIIFHGSLAIGTNINYNIPICSGPTLIIISQFVMSEVCCMYTGVYVRILHGYDQPSNGGNCMQRINVGKVC